MPFPVCRMLDTGVGVCACHATDITATIMVGLANVLVGGLPSARMTDLVLADCGDPATITTGNPTVLVGGLPKARVSDMFMGSVPVCVGPIGVLNIGLPTVLA